MKVPSQIGTVDKIIMAFNAIIEREEKTIALINSGNSFHRNNIVDVTAETMIAANQTLGSLREGIKEMERTRADLTK